MLEKGIRGSSYNFFEKIDRDSYFLMNSRTCAMDITNRKTVEQLQLLEKGKKLSIKKSEIKKLLSRGYLTEKSMKEEIENIKKFFYTHPTIIEDRIVIIPTYRCNLSCPYCCQRYVRRKKNWLTKTLTIKEVDKIFEAVSALGIKASFIELYGGEPLLKENLKIIEYIFQKGTKLGYKFSIITNGVDVKDFIPIFENYGLESIHITLDGPKNIHDSYRFKRNGEGTFDQIIESIDVVSKIASQCIVRINIEKRSVKSTQSMLNFCKERGWEENPNILVYLVPISLCGMEACPIVDYISLEEFVKELSSLPPQFSNNKAIFNSFKFIFGRPVRDVIDIFFNEKRDKIILPESIGCHACGHMFAFDPFGDIYSCILTFGKEKQKIGSYVPELKLNKNFELWKKRTVFDLPKCVKCKYAFICAGGCPLYRNPSGSITSLGCGQMKDRIFGLKSFLKIYKEKFMG